MSGSNRERRAVPYSVLPNQYGVRSRSSTGALLVYAAASFLLLTASAAHADPPAQATDSAFQKAIEQAQARTVKVYGAAIGRSPGYASGIIVSREGHILTAQGVFLAADNLRVTLADGTMHPASVVRRSAELQAALLKIDAPTPAYFDLAERPAPDSGDWILAVSNAFKVADGAEPLSVNVGVLAQRLPIDARRGVQDSPYAADAWLYDAITSNPGADGGAVVTAEGKLVGMIGRVLESKSTGTRLNYAVPADLLARFVAGNDQPLATTNPSSNGKADLGIRLFALGGRRAPAFIDRLAPDGPAAAAGLATDDLIVTIGGQIVRDAGDFKRLVEELPIGQPVVVEVKRKNELLRVELTPRAER
jgi:serine protease Do